MTTLDLRGSSGTLRLARNGGSASVRSFVIVGPKGDPGKDGATAAKGDKGDPGAPGAPGPALPADQMASLNNSFAPVAPTLRDTFQAKADGSFTTAESGQTYRNTGSNPMVISGHTMTMSGTGAGYAFTTLTAVPERFGAEVVFTPGTTGAVATLLMSKGPTDDLNNMGCHYYFGPTGWTLQVRQGGETPFPTLDVQTFATPLTQDGTTRYSVEIALSGSTLTIKHADGKVTRHTDARIAANASPVIAWEVFRSDAGQTLPKFTRVWAKAPTPTILHRDYARVVDVLDVASKLRTDLTPGVSNVAAFQGYQQEVSTGGGDGALNLFPSVMFAPLSITTTLAAATLAGATSISTVKPLPQGSVVTIGADTVTTTGAPSGSGPYSSAVPALTNAHASGDAVTANTSSRRTYMYFNPNNQFFYLPNLSVLVAPAGNFYLGSSLDAFLTRHTTATAGTGINVAWRTGKSTTASRPSASTVGQGSQFYDTTLSKPIWSDGTVWRDAMGTAV